jgi:hypothetical protein
MLDQAVERRNGRVGRHWAAERDERHEDAPDDPPHWPTTVSDVLAIFMTVTLAIDWSQSTIAATAPSREGRAIKPDSVSGATSAGRPAAKSQ